MTAFASRVAALAGVAVERLERLSGGDLSETLLIRHADGRRSVAKSGASAVEAAMLRSLAAAGAPAPAIEAEYEGILLLAFVENDGVFSPRAWARLGETVRRLHEHAGEAYGWPVDYRLGSVDLDNREATRWPAFWGDQRLVHTARLLDRPWRERVERLAATLGNRLPAEPKPSLLHGDLWPGNVLVNGGEVAALIDPACYHGDREVDLAMLSLFAEPPPEFAEAYGALEPGWEERRILYQLFPALVHMRLFGASYAALADRLLASAGV
ncbi:MAG TPA: fructosamine kinase family protein [Allosphingosinicella sp.]|jgi:fructosamine-3-kinase